MNLQLRTKKISVSHVPLVIRYKHSTPRNNQILHWNNCNQEFNRFGSRLVNVTDIMETFFTTFDTEKTGKLLKGRINTVLQTVHKALEENGFDVPDGVPQSIDGN